MPQGNRCNGSVFKRLRSHRRRTPYGDKAGSRGMALNRRGSLPHDVPGGRPFRPQQPWRRWQSAERPADTEFSPAGGGAGAGKTPGSGSRAGRPQGDFPTVLKGEPLTLFSEEGRARRRREHRTRPYPTFHKSQWQAGSVPSAHRSAGLTRTALSLWFWKTPLRH